MDTPEQIAIARKAKAEADARWAEKVREEQAARMRVNEAARNPRELEQQMGTAATELANAKVEARQINPADLEARLTAAEAVAKAAKTAFDIVQVRAQAAQVRALGDAGSDPVARAKAAAKAQSDWAEAVGTAEAEYEAASFASDRTAVAAAEARKIAHHRARAAEARLAERAKAEVDPLRASNPFADPIRPVITESQFASIRDPELKARAGREADIVPDDDPTFTKADTEALLLARGSANRRVVTRAQLAVLSPADQMQTARSSIIVD
jgi:hypothetical protein